MKVAVVYDSVPWPVRSGDTSRVFQLLNALISAGHETHLICSGFRPLGHSRNDAPDGLIVHYYQPWTVRNLLRRVKRRIDQALSQLRLPTIEQVLTNKLRISSANGVLNWWHRCPPGLDKYLNRICTSLDLDAVIVEYAWMAPSAQSLPPKVLKVIDVHDLQFQRQHQFHRAGRSFPFPIDEQQEMAIYDQFDFALAIQDREARHLQDRLRRADVLTVGHSSSHTLPMPQGRPLRLLYVGGNNEANVHGLSHFLQEIWPQVLVAAPTIRLSIAGHVQTGLPPGLRNSPQVEFLGYVEDLAPLYQSAHLCINPIWIGTGLKIKTVEALGHARPLVTTHVGIDGMVPSPGDALVVAESDQEWVAALNRLLVVKPDELEALHRSAARYALTNLNASQVYSGLLNALAAKPKANQSSRARPIH